MKTISILIPAYNEEAVLEKLFARLGNLANEVKDYDFEFLLIMTAVALYLRTPK